MLPPGDSFTQARDRDTLVDRLHQRSVWPAAGAPGIVLAAGVIAGVWARLVAELRGATDVRVDYD